MLFLVKITPMIEFIFNFCQFKVQKKNSSKLSCPFHHLVFLESVVVCIAFCICKIQKLIFEFSL